jgi:hypothetical protein
MKRKHGMSHTPEWWIWVHIRERCLDVNNPNYPAYGGRGITLHPQWREDFAAFYAEIGPRPSPKHSVDRIDNARGYLPGNIRWATSREQNQNKRSNVLLTVNGETKVAAEWARALDIPKATISRRLSAGRSEEAALAPVIRRAKRRKWDDQMNNELRRLWADRGVPKMAIGKILGVRMSRVREQARLLQLQKRVRGQ